MAQRMAEMKAQALSTAGQLKSATSKLEVTEGAKREPTPNYAMPGLDDMKKQYEACMAFFNEANPMDTGTVTDVQVFQALMAPDVARWGAGSTCSAWWPGCLWEPSSWYGAVSWRWTQWCRRRRLYSVRNAVLGYRHASHHHTCALVAAANSLQGPTQANPCCTGIWPFMSIRPFQNGPVW